MRRPRQSRTSNPDARLYDPGVALSASQCCLIPLEICSSFLGRVAIRRSPHSPFGPRRPIFRATRFERRGRVAGNRLTRRAATLRDRFQFHVKRPHVHACGPDRRPDFNGKAGASH